MVEKVFHIIQRRVAKDVTRHDSVESNKVKLKGGLEVNIVGDKEMKDLNFRYRGKNKTTDVLSFAWREDSVVKTANLGQIYICYPQIIRQAKEAGVTAKEEFVRMMSHGFLHIMGHDHIKNKEAETMFKIQEEIVDEAARN